MAEGKHKNPPVDEEYKDAIQPVVDNNMRTDILGPHFCKIMTEHSPSKEKLHEIIRESLQKEPLVREQIVTIINEYDTKRKAKWVDRALSAIVGIIITVAGAFGLKYLGL
jgi:membrane carboxypeptidase/penicillin-binding protein PbpC